MIRFADAREGPAVIMRGAISWFDGPLTVDAHVISRAFADHSETAPQAILGIGLLTGLYLFCDFQFGRVTIQKPPPSPRR
jgi:hypothetical protein